MRVAAIAGAGEVSVSRTGKDLEVAAVIRFKVFPANGALSRSNGERATLTNLGVNAYRFSSPRQVSFCGVNRKPADQTAGMAGSPRVPGPDHGPQPHTYKVPEVNAIDLYQRFEGRYETQSARWRVGMTQVHTIVWSDQAARQQP